MLVDFSLRSYFFAPACILAAVLGLTATVGQSDPRRSLEITAIVNNQLISNYDLDQYVRLMLAMAALPVTPENEDQIRNKSLERLIEDTLQYQEAQRLSLELSDEEIDQAIDSLITRNESSRDDFADFLSENGIRLETLRHRMAADLIWNKVVSTSIARAVLVSQNEVDESFRKAQSSLADPGYLLSEIFLSSAGLGGRKEALSLAQRLREQLSRQVPFATLADEFSDAPSAARGGDIGWVQSPSLAKELRTALATMEGGEVSVPIVVADGVYLVYLRSLRRSRAAQAAQWRAHLVSLFIPRAAVGAAAGAETRWREKIMNEFPGCSEVESYAGRFEGRGRDLGKIESVDLSEDLREILSDLASGHAAQIQNGSEGLDMIIFCGKEQARLRQITRQEVEFELMNRQAEMLSRQRLRDLRRDAHVEVR